MEALALGCAGKLRFHCLVDLTILGHRLRHVFAAIKPGGPGIVKVGRVVRHLVGQVDQLRLQRRAQSRQVGVQTGTLARAEIVRMFDDPSRTSKLRFSPGNRA